MAQITTSTYIDATPDEVFAAFTDFNRASGMINDILKVQVLTDGPARQGTRFRETRTVLGREVTEELEIVDFQPHAEVPTYTARCESCGTIFDTVFRFVPEGEGTHVEVSMTTMPRTIGAKILSPLGWMMKGTLRKCLDKDCSDLKRVIERESLATVGAK